VQKNYLLTYPRIVVHEIGHAFDLAMFGFTGKRLSSSVPSTLYRPLTDGGVIMHQDPTNYLYFGYAGGVGDWQFGWEGSQVQEEFADMFIGWTYNTWGSSPYPQGSPYNERGSEMNKLMLGGLVEILSRYYHLPVRVGDVKNEPIWY